MTPAPPSANSLSSAVVNRMSSLTTATRSGSPDIAISKSSEILTSATLFISKCAAGDVLIAAGADQAPSHGDHRAQPLLGAGRPPAFPRSWDRRPACCREPVCPQTGMFDEVIV